MDTTTPKPVFIFVHPKMMPGQTPYTREEFEKVCELIAAAAEANVIEDDEINGDVR